LAAYRALMQSQHTLYSTVNIFSLQSIITPCSLQPKSDAGVHRLLTVLSALWVIDPFGSAF